MNAQGSDPAAAIFVDPVLTERTFEQAIERLIEGIERSRLRRGDRLPTEAALAEQLGISKPTLRQGLRVLERAGLIEVRRGAGGGIIVAADLVPVDLLRTHVAAEEHHVVETLIGRRLIEGGAAKVAALEATAEDFGELQRTIDLLAAHVGERAPVMRADAAFHRAVSLATHNRTIQAAMRLLGKELAPIRDTYPGESAQDALTVEIHQQQLDAMRAHDLNALDPILDRHFRQLEEEFSAAVGSSWSSLFAARVGPLLADG